ncbi:type ISP restriction/modification enzyme [Streptomyces sp. NPDC057702]|uniref:type ISP restriction/modification enzyme n=1 Tax=unclassified Streptomyces TaxID=2593676 RepID=UPI0036B9B002
MPWSVAPLRLGRSWVMAADAPSLAARWDRLLRSDDAAERAALFRPTRARTPHTAVAQLPGQPGSTTRFARERGRCPQPVRIAHGPYDQQWLIPDHRLIDEARPELWRVADAHQIHLLEPAGEAPPRAGRRGPRGSAAPGPAPTDDADRDSPAGPGVDAAGPLREEAELAFTALLPDGFSPAGRPGRIRPLYRRPGAREPNLAPGLLAHLTRRLGHPVTAEDLFAWTAAAARRGPAGATVLPLTASPGTWEAGVALGRHRVWLHTRGARGGPAPGAAMSGSGTPAGRPRLPGGQRPYVRAPLTTPLAPDALGYDPEERALCLGNGRISPVARAAWEYHSGGVRVVESWFERRVAPAAPGTLEAVGPRGWPQEWTSDLLELITVLTLLAELREPARELAKELADGPLITEGELRAAGVLPAPESARRPASVLDHPEEGPEGQFALL